MMLSLSVRHVFIIGLGLLASAPTRAAMLLNDTVGNATDLPPASVLTLKVGDDPNRLSAKLPPNTFRTPQTSTAKRQANSDVAYTMFYSDQNITFDSNLTLNAVPVKTGDLRGLLSHAIELASAGTANDFRRNFNVSANNLTLIATTINSTPDAPTFNWDAYGAVAGALLRSTDPTSNGFNKSWVGVIQDPAGAEVAIVVVSPDIIVAPAAAGGDKSAFNSPPASPAGSAPTLQSGRADKGAFTSPSATSAAAAPTTKAGGAIDGAFTSPQASSATAAPTFQSGGADGSLRLKKRDLYDIPGTSMQVTVTPGRHVLAGAVFNSLVSEAANSVFVQRLRQGFGGVFIGYWADFKFWQDNVFHLLVTGGAQISYSDMADILITLITVARSYEERTGNRAGPNNRAMLDSRVRNLQGQVISAAGTVIAKFFIGGPEGQLGEVASTFLCPRIGVVQPDGEVSLGCLT